jgi:hypothetical protein
MINNNNILTYDKSCCRIDYVKHGSTPIKSGSTFFLKRVILLIAIGVLAGLLWFPQTEGRAAHLDLISIYTDPFILYIYICSLPFFVGLYHAIRLLTFINSNKAISQSAVNTLRNIKFASLSQIGFIVLALFYIRFAAHGDDPAGPTALGIMTSFAFAVIAATAVFFQNRFRNALQDK